MPTPHPGAAPCRCEDDGGGRITLPDGRTLIVRAAQPSDAGGLELLYRGLSEDDRHLRFFALYRPPAAFYDRLANAVAEGGFCLVGVVDDPSARIVAEADWFLLPNGDGELAVTVASDWRGWLGPYLFDALIESAAARGVPNLQAEVLAENRRMLALIHHRSFAMVDGTDFSTVRVVIGTRTPTPVWSGPRTRPRVLAEVPGGRWRAEQAVRDAGMQVMVCPGPRPGDDAHCPAVDGAPCPLVEGADVVVCGLHPGHGRDDDVRAAHAVVHPGVPVVLDLPVGAGGDVTVARLRAVLATPDGGPATPAQG